MFHFAGSAITIQQLQKGLSFFQTPCRARQIIYTWSIWDTIPYQITPQKINIERENDGLEDDFAFPRMHSQVPSGV